MPIKKRKNILPQVRAKILEEMRSPDCIVAELARSHGFSKSALYKLRKRLKVRPEQSSSVMNSDANFIEVSVKETEPCNLKKASLTFDDFSIFIEGKISSTKLLAVLKVLEGSC